MTFHTSPIIRIIVALLVIQAMFGAVFADRMPSTFELKEGSSDSSAVFLSSADLDQMIHTDSPSFHTASIVDGEGKVWDGVLLRELITEFEREKPDQAFSPDFNSDKIRSEEVSIVITGSNGDELILQAEEINSSRNYLLANAVDGYPLSRDNDSYPFTLVGKGFRDDEYIRGVSEVEFMRD